MANPYTGARKKMRSGKNIFPDRRRITGTVTFTGQKQGKSESLVKY